MQIIQITCLCVLAKLFRIVEVLPVWLKTIKMFNGIKFNMKPSNWPHYMKLPILKYCTHILPQMSQVYFPLGRCVSRWTLRLPLVDIWRPQMGQRYGWERGMSPTACSTPFEEYTDPFAHILKNIKVIFKQLNSKIDLNKNKIWVIMSLMYCWTI